jgi:hypothetical protein
MQEGLSRRARGWLRYLYRKVHLYGDDWSHRGQPSPAWDNRTGPPMSNFYRFDAIEASNSVALMAEQTPAWREIYSDVLLGICRRLVQHHAFNDWVEQRGPDPRRGDYPDSWKGTLVPDNLWGDYDAPGWAANGTQPSGYEPDPVVRGAMFYKGFLNVVLGLYELVSGQTEFDEPFDIVYDDDTRFSYSHRTINSIVEEAFGARDEPHGLTCEVAKLWPL